MKNIPLTWKATDTNFLTAYSGRIKIGEVTSIFNTDMFTCRLTGLRHLHTSIKFERLDTLEDAKQKLQDYWNAWCDAADLTIKEKETDNV